MSRPDARRVDSGPLPYLLALPEGDAPPGGWPLLCFLHGHGEGAPMPIRQALTRHGPLAPSASPRAAELIIVAPQMPARGDLWRGHAEDVEQIVRQVQALHPADPARTYLTGFSFGGNGVLDLALADAGPWAALWAVDPTRVPPADPGRPLWLSSGEISRHAARAFRERLGLQVPEEGGEPGERVYVDQGQDHVGTARLAYADDRVYAWLLSHRLSPPDAE